MTIFLGGSSLIAESSQMVFDPHEADILRHRPIHPRTLLLAKAISLFALSAVVAVALNLVPMFLGLALPERPWWFPVTHLAGVLLAAAFCSGAVVFVYAFLARLIGRQRFDGLRPGRRWGSRPPSSSSTSSSRA